MGSLDTSSKNMSVLLSIVLSIPAPAERKFGLSAQSRNQAHKRLQTEVRKPDHGANHQAKRKNRKRIGQNLFFGGPSNFFDFGNNAFKETGNLKTDSFKRTAELFEKPRKSIWFLDFFVFLFLRHQNTSLFH